jgi:hypothetical protein
MYSEELSYLVFAEKYWNRSNLASDPFKDTYMYSTYTMHIVHSYTLVFKVMKGLLDYTYFVKRYIQ